MGVTLTNIEGSGYFSERCSGYLSSRGTRVYDVITGQSWLYYLPIAPVDLTSFYGEHIIAGWPDYYGFFYVDYVRIYGVLTYEGAIPSNFLVTITLAGGAYRSELCSVVYEVVGAPGEDSNRQTIVIDEVVRLNGIGVDSILVYDVSVQIDSSPWFSSGFLYGEIRYADIPTV